ncbi:DUF4952 domain-containing protein [Achromobacter marplatensis]|uniref:DUF4952 domain-containing protein n=1 Tax=Achromobacter marplatensis TaxID=470868 RepID=A0AA43B3J2_9BURK|nr:DUF4952 domain-containing protein [Achromobacter marplatensis]MDH2054020.1 DUF4952 domain-containing protein [Achromobacter marplatensis]
MNVILRPAWLAWVVLPLCLLALAAGKASAQTSTPGDALADWVANGRALGLVRPDTPCQDFLKTLGKKPDYVEYLGCEQDDDSYIQPMEARYRVSGAFAAEMEAYLGQTFGMPPLEYICCGWANRGPFFWRDGSGSVSYEISMGVETLRIPRSQWQEIPSFSVRVGVIRKSP